MPTSKLNPPTISTPPRMRNATNRIRIGAAAVLAVALAAVGCTSEQQAADDPQIAASVTVHDQWVKAADSGMTAVFGTFHNTGDRDARVASASSPAAGRVELHEVVAQPDGSTAMRPKEGGFVIPAGGSHELAPGGDHLMLMDLTSPLKPGQDITVTAVFDDGSSLPFTAQVRDFPGAGEQYQPSAGHLHG